MYRAVRRWEDPPFADDGSSALVHAVDEQSHVPRDGGDVDDDVFRFVTTTAIGLFVLPQSVDEDKCSDGQ